MRTGVTWVRVAGVAAALITGCLLSAAAVHVSGFPGPPAESDAVTAATTAMGRPPIDTPGPVVVCDYWCPEYAGDNVVAYDSPPDRTDVVAVTYSLPQGRAAETEFAARVRLEDAGWQSRSDGTLTRDNLVLGLQITDTPSGVQATVVASKAVSPLAVTLAVAGFLIGAALGWLVAAGAARRFRRHGDSVRALAGTLTVVVIAVTFGYATTAVLLLYNGGAWPDAQFAEFLLTVFPSISIAVVTATVVVLALIALPPRREGLLRLGPTVGQTGNHGAARS